MGTDFIMQNVHVNTIPLHLKLLFQLMRQFHHETNVSTRLLNLLNYLADRFFESGKIIEKWSILNTGNKQLIFQLTPLIYCECELLCRQFILINIGGGYYIEKTQIETIKYCRRRLFALRDKVEFIQNKMLEKCHAYTNIRQKIIVRVAETYISKST